MPYPGDSPPDPAVLDRCPAQFLSKFELGHAQRLFSLRCPRLRRLARKINNDHAANATDIDLLFAATAGAIPPANALDDVNHDSQVIKTVNVTGSDADYLGADD